MHFAEKMDRFISNAGNPFSRSEAKKIQARDSRLGLFRIWNSGVDGSIPSGSTKLAGLVQWQNGSLVSCASEVRFLCPAPEPTTWDPSAREPVLPYPHIARLSRAFLFQAPGTILDMPSC